MYSDSELELVGAIIGDGHIHKSSKYYFGLTGNKITDREYYSKLSVLIGKVWNKHPRVFESGRGLRIRVYSKNIVTKLTMDFGLAYNSDKCYSVEIPEFLLDDYSKVKHVIRGIADTDGSVFVSDKKGSPNYPSLEITTVCRPLADQLREILLCAGFRVTNIRKYWSKRSTTDCYKVCLYGRDNLRKWVSEIGFTNPYKEQIAKQALTERF
ncbi:MAG TPA: LAGLIDADG family homing endonuclease [archaeon]|nr:LAGLIDADG family homing endonuclease [archaeon]